MTGAEAIRAENVVKTFGTITALAGVSLEVAWGETLGILGDNGAGKSTLIKILTGYHQPDSGHIFVDGKPVQLASVDEARALGIECVYQDLALVNGLSIYHNMFLNRELLRRGPLRLLDHREMRRRAAEALDEIGVDVPSVELAVGALSGGQRQAIAVARAVYSKAQILLLDEPLAAMGAREARLIIGLIERLRARRHRDRDDRAQLRADLGDLRPDRPDAARRDHLREPCRGDLGRGAPRDHPPRIPRRPRRVICAMIKQARGTQRLLG